MKGSMTNKQRNNVFPKTEAAVVAKPAPTPAPAPKIETPAAEKPKVEVTVNTAAQCDSQAAQIADIINLLNHTAKTSQRPDIFLACMLKPGGGLKWAIKLGESHWIQNVNPEPFLRIICTPIEITAQQAAENTAKIEMLKTQLEFIEVMDSWATQKALGIDQVPNFKADGKLASRY